MNPPMTLIDQWILAGVLIACLCGAFGAWMLHARLRKPSSLVFALSFCAFVAWLPALDLLQASPLVEQYSPNDARWLYQRDRFRDLALSGAGALLMIVGVSFLLTVRSLGRQKDRTDG